jgi:hypothetical protein
VVRRLLDGVRADLLADRTEDAVAEVGSVRARLDELLERFRSIARGVYPVRAARPGPRGGARGAGRRPAAGGRPAGLRRIRRYPWEVESGIYYFVASAVHWLAESPGPPIEVTLREADRRLSVEIVDAHTELAEAELQAALGQRPRTARRPRRRGRPRPHRVLGRAPRLPAGAAGADRRRRVRHEPPSSTRAAARRRRRLRRGVRARHLRALGWLALGGVAALLRFWPGLLDPAAGPAASSPCSSSRPRRRRPSAQLVVDGVLSLLEIGIAVALAVRQPRWSWSGRLLALGLVGLGGRVQPAVRRGGRPC